MLPEQIICFERSWRDKLSKSRKRQGKSTKTAVLITPDQISHFNHSWAANCLRAGKGKEKQGKARRKLQMRGPKQFGQPTPKV